MRQHFALLLALTLALAACENGNQANPDAPVTYSANWVTFSYPGSWTLNDNNADRNPGIRIQGPHKALFSIHIRGLEQAPELPDFIASLGNAQNLTPTGRPATSGRLHGFIQSLELDGVPYLREYHRVDSHDEVAYLVSEVPAANAFRVQNGLDRIFTTFAFQ